MQAGEAVETVSTQPPDDGSSIEPLILVGRCVCHIRSNRSLRAKKKLPPPTSLRQKTEEACRVSEPFFALRGGRQ
jgi:hypothetical protein